MNLNVLRACHVTISSKFKHCFAHHKEGLLKTHEVDQSHKSQRVPENYKTNQTTLPKVTQSITLPLAKLPATPIEGHQGYS